MNNKYVIVLGKISFLVAVMGLLVAHGSSTGQSGSGRGQPCFPYNSTDPAVICIDGTDTQQDISNLSSRSSVVDVNIMQTQLENLNFLKDLQSITRKIRIIGNPNLAKISTAGDFLLTELPNLMIKDNVSLTDLEGFGNVVQVGNVEIYGNTALTTLAHFSVGTTSQEINIGGNSALQDLYALNQLTSLSGSLSIGGNNLNNLNDLAALNSVGGLYITEGNIANLAGLDNLSSVDGYLVVSYCANLVDLQGLSSLSQFSTLKIQYNDQLTSLSGLAVPPSLDEVSITYNAMLNDISSLSTLTAVSGILYFDNNSALVSVAALSNVQSVGKLAITNNAQLGQLGLAALGLIDSADSGFYIMDNVALCEQDAQDLLDQVLAAGGVGTSSYTTDNIKISGNLQVCTP